jgi:hypothetical protein
MCIRDRRSTADPPAGGVRGDELREAFFQVQQLVEELVIFPIRDGWIIQDIIAMGVFPEKPVQFQDPYLCLRGQGYFGS